MKKKIQNFLEDRFGPPTYEAQRWHKGDYNTLSSIANNFDGYLTRIRPYRNSEGIKEAEQLISTLYDPSVERSWMKEFLGLNKEPKKHSFEMWFSDDKLRFVMKSPDKDEAQELRKTISGIYPHAQVSNSKRHMPNISEGSYVAGGEFGLKHTKYAPLRAFTGPDPFEVDKVEESDQVGSVLVDPYKTVTSELTGHQSEAVLFQITFTPVSENWTEGFGPRDPSAERIGEYLKEGRYVDSLKNPRIIDPTPKDLRTAEHITDLESSQAFDVNIRYFVWDQTKESAIRHVKAIENIFRSVYQNNKVSQQFEATRYTTDNLKENVFKAAKREVERKDVIVTKEELAALAHLPNDTINTPNVDFVESVFGEQAPGESSTANKEGLTDKGEENIVQQFAEVKEYHPELADDVDGEGATVYEKARELVAKTENAYYRTDIQPEDYPETSITEPMSPETKKKFLGISTRFEHGDIGYDHFYDIIEDDEKADEVISDVEDHIDEAFLIDAKKRTIENGNASSLDASENPNDLPTTPERLAQSTDGGNTNGESTSGDEETLPANQSKHPVNFTETNYAQTRKKDGSVVTMNFTQEDNKGNLYMGKDSRELFIESHKSNKDEDIWIGYQEEGNASFREVGIPKSAWFQHTSIFGTTGKGKSTLMKNMALQVSNKGHGFVMIDPKGDMSKELMKELPEDRLDDVIWVEPGAIEHEKIAAINFLQTSVDKDHPRYDREVESIVNDLQAVLRAGEYWGPKMAGITKNITRAMVRSENPYTLYDMYNVLIREEKRWNFARSLQREDVDLGDSASGDISEDVKQYSRRIAEMDDEEVDPVVRRLQDWAESPISKEIVSHRYSSVNIDQAVNDGKIILLKNSVEDREIKRVISTAIMRRVWVAIQARAETTEEEDRDPFFAFIDEFDDVVSEDMSIDKMLTKARSGRMSVTLAMQNPSQISNEHENVLKQIFNNTKTMVSFGVLDPDDGYLIAKRMGEDFTSNDMTSMPDYRVVTRVSYIGENGPQISQPLGLKTFPDYPPLRTSPQAFEAIEASLDEYGVLPMDNYPGETDLLISGGGLQEQTVVNFLELVWNEHHRAQSEIISVESIADQFEDVVGERIEHYPNGIAVPEKLINVHNVNFDEEDGDEGHFNEPEFFADKPGGSGKSSEDTEDNNSEKIAYKSDGRIYIQKNEAKVSVTGEGIDAILQQDSGRSQPTESHREIIWQSVRWFSRLGFHTHVPVQTGSNTVCDARADIPINKNLSIGELRDALATFEEDYQLAAALSESNNLNIEAEGTTQRKPARTIENVLRAQKRGRDVILVVKDGRTDGHGRDYHANRVENILTSPPYYRENRLYPPGVDPGELQEDEENMEPVRFLYNKGEKLRVGNPNESQEKFALLPKGSQTVWFDMGDHLNLYDGHGQHAKKQGEVKYSETSYASSNAMDTWCRYDSYQKEWVVYPGNNQQFRYDTKEAMEEEYQFVYAPLYMESEVDELPDEDSWKILILPDPDAITTDPNESEQTNDDELTVEEKYQLDFCFPPEEVPLVYEDGSTRPMVPEEFDDLLTESRAEFEDRDEDETDSDTPAGIDPTTNTTDTTGELTMDSFEQIEMEKEAKNIIEGYRKQLTHEEKKRLEEIDGVFGAKNPGQIDFWREIWDEFERDYDTGIPESVLPDAIRTATGLVKQKAKDAVGIGQDFDLLVTDKPKGELSVDIPDDDSILRLVIPAERPDLYLEDAEEYADKRIWESVWEYAFAEPNEPLERSELISIAQTRLDLENTKEAQAAVGVAEMSGSIETGPSRNEYLLGPDRPDEFWITVWEKVNKDLSQPIQKNRVLRGIRAETDHDREGVIEVFETALEHNELYSPMFADDDHYVINDPSTDDGPEIIEHDESYYDDSDDDFDDDPDPDTDTHADEESPEESPEPEHPESESPSSETPEGDSQGTDNSEEPATPTADASEGTSDTADQPANTEAAESPTEESSGQDDQSDTDDDKAVTDEQPATTSAQSTDTDTSTTDSTESDSYGEGENEGEDEDEEEEKTPSDKFKDEVKENPPEWSRVKEAFAEAIEFFHSQIDESINSNIQWNVDNPNARLTKPETAREYFQHPRHDDDTADSLKLIRPEGVAAGDLGNHVKQIPSDARKKVNDYLPEEDIPPVVNSDPLRKGTDDAPMLVEPYSYQSRENRGWTPETIEDKKLGWAPSNPKALYDHLIQKGFTKAEMVATGLFYANGESVSLTSHFTGRYVFPYFNKDNEPVYAISRSIDTDRKSHKKNDSQYNQKYTKAIKNQDYSMVDEPIYGMESVVEGQPLLITEGMADAISAHEKGIPCISPVTRKFKTAHAEILKDIILENNIPEVYIIQDADPALVHDLDKDDCESISEGLTIGQYGSGMEGAADTARYLDKIALDAHGGSVGSSDVGNESSDDTKKTQAVDGESESESGSASESASESESPTDDDQQNSVEQLVAEAKAGTQSRAFETYIIPLPRYGGIKYDLDDYLTDKLGVIAPPALWAANNTIEGHDNCEWVDKLHSNRHFRYFTGDQYRALNEGEFEGEHPLPSASIQNHLPTIAPANIPAEAGSGKGASTPRIGDRPDADWNKNKSNSNGQSVFDLTLFDVFGLSEGFRGKSPLGHLGDSENYFCVLESDGAYCHKRDVWYNPATAILCLEGERPKDNPYGSFSDEEKFILWEHARKNRIKYAQIPNDALVYYALREGIATEDDIIERDGPYGKFDGLRGRKYHETIDNLVEDYDFEIIRDIERNKDDDEDNSEEEDEDNSNDYEVDAKEAMDHPDMVDPNEIFDEDTAKEIMGEADDEEDGESESSDEDDELARFLTYEEPDLSTPGIDVDSNAVAQFVEEFATTYNQDKTGTGIRKDELVNTFTKWAKLNDIDLDDLSDRYSMQYKKTQMKKALESTYDITDGKVNKDGSRFKGFKQIELSKSGQELQKYDLDG